jgi:hypothetical protein
LRHSCAANLAQKLANKYLAVIVQFFGQVLFSKITRARVGAPVTCSWQGSSTYAFKLRVTNQCFQTSAAK